MISSSSRRGSNPLSRSACRDGLHQIRLQLLGRYVDGDADLVRPHRGILAGAVQHPPPDRVDQADAFGGCDERRRRHQTAHRMLPADQGFERGYPPGLEIELRLILQQEAAGGHRISQIGEEYCVCLPRFWPLDRARGAMKFHRDPLKYLAQPVSPHLTVTAIFASMVCSF